MFVDNKADALKKFLSKFIVTSEPESPEINLENFHDMQFFGKIKLGTRTNKYTNFFTFKKKKIFFIINQKIIFIQINIKIFSIIFHKTFIAA